MLYHVLQWKKGKKPEKKLYRGRDQERGGKVGVTEFPYKRSGPGERADKANVGPDPAACERVFLKDSGIVCRIVG